MLNSKIIDLFRHGTPALSGVYLGQTDSPLSHEGARECRDRLEEHRSWELIISSPLQRCLHTASWLAKKQGIELLIAEGLQEYDFGDWDGQVFEEVYQQMPEHADRFWRDPEHNPPPKGETLHQFKQRITTELEALLLRPEQKILIVTHGGVIRGIIAEMLGVSPEHWGRIRLDYAKFTQLKYDYDGTQFWPQLISCNSANPY